MSVYVSGGNYCVAENVNLISTPSVLVIVQVWDICIAAELDCKIHFPAAFTVNYQEPEVNPKDT